ncbi:MAG: hypothetical protein M3Q23_03435 [Actinomycetota bacterium]|nr:hypothetical protein [Actinomycetota bacterium]
MGEREIEALEEGRGFVDLSSWRKVLLSGRDAVAWLNDLVTSRVDDLRPHLSRRALLLDRTGHVRADIAVAGMDDGLLLVQDPVQPHPIDQLLDRYVLSSDVRLTDRSEDVAIVAEPGAGAVAFDGSAPAWGPSVVGSGFDRILDRAALPDHLARMQAFTAASLEDLEVWRIRHGLPRFGIDFGEDSLPQEAGLDALVDQTKGCFLGQEAMAKVRNLGHPPWVVLALRSEVAVHPGQPVVAGDEQAGHVTSAALVDGGSAFLARVRWQFRDEALEAAGGGPFLRA